jgi:hypothetical protein
MMGTRKRLCGRPPANKERNQSTHEGHSKPKIGEKNNVDKTKTGGIAIYYFPSNQPTNGGRDFLCTSQTSTGYERIVVNGV